MIKGIRFLYIGLWLFGVALSLVSEAAVPPAGTYLLKKQRGANSWEIEVSVVLPASPKTLGHSGITQVLYTEPIHSVQIGYELTIKQSAVIHDTQGNGQGPVFGIITSCPAIGGSVLDFIGRSGFVNPVGNFNNISAITEYNDRFILFADTNNRIIAVDANGNEVLFVNAPLLDSNQYGPIKRMQLVGPDTLAVVTDSHFLTVRVSWRNSTQAFIMHEIPLNALLGNRSLKTTVFDFVANAIEAWIWVQIDNSNYQSSELLSVSVYSLRRLRSQPLWQGVNNSDIQFLNLSTLIPTDLSIKNGDSYVQVDGSGNKINNTFPPFLDTTLVNQHRDSQSWLSRAVYVFSCGPSLAPVTTPVIATPVSQAPRPAVITSPVQAPPAPKKKVLDPITADEFRRFMERELGPMGTAKLNASGLTVEAFCQLISATQNTGYYFKGISAAEQQQLGIEYARYSIRPLNGREKSTISVQAVTQVLAAIKARETAAKP